MPESDWDLDGRLCMTRTRNGDKREIHHLELTGEWVFKAQRVFEHRAVDEENYLKVREAVLLAEQLRAAVAKEQKQGRPQGDEGGE